MTARRVLVTGGSGFVGQWACHRFLDAGYTVFAGTIGQKTGPAVLSDEQRSAVRWLQLDTASDDAVARALQDAAPDWVLHLAAMAFPPDAAAAPTKAFEVNAFGALRIIHQLAEAGAKQVRVLVIGSAEQYGAPPSVTPVPESTAQVPLSIYAASKAAQELISLQAGKLIGVATICTRSFNHSGFGHGPQYLLPSLVARVAALPKKGGQLRLGNGTPVRDYLHVADTVAAYEALLDRGQAGEAYNVSSGRGVTVQSIAERLLKRLEVDAEIASDPALVRSVDVPYLVGDNAKLRAATGWQPRLSLDDMFDDLIHATTR